MYGGKFAFQNRLSWLVVGWKFTIFALFCFVNKEPAFCLCTKKANKQPFDAGFKFFRQG